MKWIYIAIGIMIIYYGGHIIEEYYDSINIYIIQGGVAP